MVQCAGDSRRGLPFLQPAHNGPALVGLPSSGKDHWVLEHVQRNAADQLQRLFMCSTKFNFQQAYTVEGEASICPLHFTETVAHAVIEKQGWRTGSGSSSFPGSSSPLCTLADPRLWLVLL